MNAGLPEWIAADGGDYVARAVSHVRDLHRLASLRSGLWEQVSHRRSSCPVLPEPRLGHACAASAGTARAAGDRAGGAGVVRRRRGDFAASERSEGGFGSAGG